MNLPRLFHGLTFKHLLFSKNGKTDLAGRFVLLVNITKRTFTELENKIKRRKFLKFEVLSANKLQINVKKY